jgi:ABC-type glycerol-3-phosphate transport system substrate-binding protein
MIRRLRGRRGRLFVLPLILLAGAVVASAVRWGPGSMAWAADPTVRYISHRFPMLEFWAKKMGEYPGIKFESELIPFDQALEKMQIHLSQGAPTYDIMATDAFLPTFAERGWLMPLDPLIEKFRQAVEWDDINPTLVRDVCSYKGKVYGVPNLSISMFFFYRKDLLDAAGLKPPETMDEWIATAKALTKPDQKQYGTAMTLKAGDGFQNDFTYFLRTYGGDWYDKDWKVTIDSEAGVKALTTMKELMKYAPPNVLAFHNDESTVAMQQGLTTMGLLWQSRAAAMDNAQVSQVVGKVQFAVPPAATKGGRSHPRLAVGCYSISAYTKNDPGLVFQVIAKTMNKANMRESAGLATPTRMSVTRDPEVTQKFRFIKAASDNIQAGARLVPTNPEFSEAMLQVTQTLQKGLTAELTIPESLKRAQKVMHDLMTEKGYYKK